MTPSNPLSRTSTTLLGEVAQGASALAEREFVSRYGSMIRALALGAGLGGDDADDVRQEVLMAAVTALREQRYDRERARFKTFLRAIIGHKLRDALGKLSAFSPQPSIASAQCGHPTTDFHDLVDPHPTPAEAFEAAFEAEWQKVAFEDALDEIRLEVEPLTFQAFDLYARKGRSPQEVARLLGVKKSLVYTAKSRILDRIREKIAAS